MQILKKVSLVLMIIFYLAAGVNHFHDPSSYIKIIPNYFPYKPTLNILAGFFELLFGIMLMFNKTRALAGWGIILILIAFVPVHVQMVKDAPFLLGDKVTVSPFVAWIRLIVLQPLLILWAWWYTGAEKS